MEVTVADLIAVDSVLFENDTFRIGDAKIASEKFPFSRLPGVSRCRVECEGDNGRQKEGNSTFERKNKNKTKKTFGGLEF